MALPTQTVSIAISLDDGSVSVMQFITFGRSVELPFGAEWFGPPTYWTRLASPENIQHEINKTFSNVGRIGSPLPQPVSWQVVDSVPTDRTYRDAWIFTNNAFSHNMNKAKQIHLDRLRFERNKKLQALDGPWMKAVASGNTQEAANIEAQRQILRDLPQDPAIAAATTVDELKASWPATLK